MKSQKCISCNTVKPIDDFYKHQEMANGHLGICKECVKKRQKKRMQTEEGKICEKKRNAKPERKKHLAENSKKWRKNNPEKALAHSRLWHAISKGKVIRKKECEECGSSEKIHAHHEDYSKPYDVKWLCPVCHGKRNPNYHPF